MADILVGDTGNAITNGANLQTAINAANPGDNLILTAGAYYDGTFTLLDRGASVNFPITIKGTNTNSYPAARVSPTYASSMPKCRTLGTGGITTGVFEAGTNAGYWILDGLELLDNTADSITVPAMIAFNQGYEHHMTIQRCYIHGKQTGTDYYRNIRFAIQFEGTGCLVKWCYIGPILGYYKSSEPAYTMIDTDCFCSVGGSNLTIEDNYLSAWYVEMFFGGGDTLPLNTATVTSSSTTSGTFSNVTGIAPEMVLRFDFAMTGTWNNSTNVFTRTSGATMTSADLERRGRVVQGLLSGVYRITAVSGNDYTMACDAGNNNIPSGAMDVTIYEMAMVDSVVGSVVNFTPFGLRSLAQAPTFCSYNYGTQGLVDNVIIRNNLFDIPTAFANHAKINNGNNPKGYWEVKNASNMLVEGNRFQGYPASIGWTASNQNGTAPWCTVRDVTVRNNWVEEISVCILADNQYTDTNTPSKNFYIYNNLFKGQRNVFQGGNGSSPTDKDVLKNIQIYHNTFIQDVNSPFGAYYAFISNSGCISGFVCRDNIGDYISYGLQCIVDPFTQATCWPSGTFLKNAIIDSQAVGFGGNVWGTNSILTPIQTSLAAVGFTNMAANNYRLLSSSPYYKAASDGTDPGVNWDQFDNVQNSGSEILLGACMQ